MAIAQKDIPSLKVLLAWHYRMVLARTLEQKVFSLYEQRLIRGYCHLYTGQEAVAVGTLALRDEKRDEIITAYRCHVHALLTSGDPVGVLAELLGRERGLSKGRGGSMHIFSADHHFYGGHGIVGSSVPLGTGLALSQKMRATGGITMVYFGDGAVNQGQVYESWNMAALYGLPVLYILENNKYGLGTCVARASAGEALRKRAKVLGIQDASADGMNVLSVFKAAKVAVDYVRKEQKPYLLELETYRYFGHSMSDPATYRTKQEVAKMREQRDPILQLEKCIEKTYPEKKAQKKIEGYRSEIETLVDKAADEAKQAPNPLVEDLLKYVYVEE